MSTSATLPSTIQIRPSRLTGLVVAVAILTGVATWSVNQVTTESHASGNPKSEVVSTPGSAAKAYVDGVVALDPEQRAAVFGNLFPTQSPQSVNALSPELQAVNVAPTQSPQSVNALSPELQAVNVAPTQRYPDAIAALPRDQLVAMFGTFS